MINLTPRNIVQWNQNRNLYIFIQENAFENVVCEMAAILSQPQCVIQCMATGSSDWVTDIYIEGLGITHNFMHHVMYCDIKWIKNMRGLVQTSNDQKFESGTGTISRTTSLTSHIKLWHLSFHSIKLDILCCVYSSIVLCTWLFSSPQIRSFIPFLSSFCFLTYWGRVTHICVNKLTIIGSDNGLSPGRRAKPLSEPMLEYC